MKTFLAIISLGLLLTVTGCSPTVTVKHEVAPIYITMDVNIRVQKELEDFFDFEDDPVEEENKSD